jgi:predicted  nucleic acid-binding Zn-ribbon protein
MPADVEEQLAPLFEEIGKLRSLVEDYRATACVARKKVYQLEKRFEEEIKGLRSSREQLKRRVAKLEAAR